MKDKRFFFNSLPIIQALLAAILFGISAPLSKLMLGELNPIPLAGLLYLGSGLGALVLTFLQKVKQKKHLLEPSITRQDIPWLTGAIVTGGIVAPILLLLGLSNTPSSTASLLLNFETVATALLAGLFFKESIGKRIILSIIIITSASILLSWQSGQWGFSASALLILFACFFWGLDNNFTRNISIKSPLKIVTLKGLIAGSFSIVLSLFTHQQVPNMGAIFLALLIGAICYGCSIWLIILALRNLGSTRTYALFAIAPFVGTLLSFFLFKVNLFWNFWPGIILMALGTWLMISEKHIHSHLHETLMHTHKHHHPNEHHQHQHQQILESDFAEGTHVHEHLHEEMEHSHLHTPDTHHRHIHNQGE